MTHKGGFKMIEIGKRDNGATLFDNDDLLKVHITGQPGLDFLVLFDNSAYEKLQGSYYGWGIKNMTIIKNTNPKLCLPIEDFFKNFNDIIANNIKKYNYYQSKNIIDNLNGNDTVYYISDDDCDIDATMLSLTRYKELGFSIDFYRSSKDLKKLSVLFKSAGSRFPELYPFYVECFTRIIQLATKPYEECQEEFDHAFIKRKKERNILD